MTDRVNRRIVAELGRLQAGGVLTAPEVQRIAERYPTGDWDIVSLVRVFTILGAIAAGAGALVMAARHMNALRLLEGSLAAAIVVLLAGARWIRARDMGRTAAAMEMGAGFAVQGLTTVLATDFSSGSDNWPALIGVQTLLLVAMAYALQNRLVLGHASVTAFVWFGGETGYVSGWGMYWLGMSYPLRFAAAGCAAMAIAWAHAQFGGRYQSFSRVYAHFGALVLHLALWFLSIFGNFRDYVVNWHNDGERLAFTGLWAAVSVAFILTGARTGVGLLRSYGIVFLIINVYTFYFQFVAGNWAALWWLHLLIVGGSLLAVGFRLESWLRPKPAGQPGAKPAPDPPSS
jgi:hypothetical protein